MSYRLYRYRREFNRLITARNTTKSRFLRLFIICLFVIVVYLPFSLWILVNLSSEIKDPYNWNDVHGPKLRTILKIPVFGQVSIEKWVQVATGYVFFFVFGTGTDSHNLYKKMLLALGFGKVFPNLYVKRESGSSTPRSFIVAKAWSSNLSSRAKSMFFSKTDTTVNTLNNSSSTGNNSIALETVTDLRPVTTEDTILSHKQGDAERGPSQSKSAFFKRIFRTDTYRDSVLPLFSRRPVTEFADSDRSVTRAASPRVHSHAWASNKPPSQQASVTDGVHIIREIHQDRHARHQAEQSRRSVEAWA